MGIAIENMFIRTMPKFAASSDDLVELVDLHVNDNKGQWDDHVLPYQGTIQRERFMKALGEIGYQGEFTYEIHNFSKGFDAGFHQEAVTFARKLGQYMVTLM